MVVIGAGAAGLYCAGLLGQQGRQVVVLDHARRIGEKIRVSGGGRCNFTNLHGADPARYLCTDPRFVRYALKEHPPERFIARVRRAGIGFHEKHLGQLFCNDSSQQIIDMLLADCRRGGVQIRHPVTVTGMQRLVVRESLDQHESREAGGSFTADGPFPADGSFTEDAPFAKDDVVRPGEKSPAAAGAPAVSGIRALQDPDAGQAPRFEIRTTAGVLRARCLVIATGGLSIPAIGASDFAWQLATEWGLQTIAPRPGLVPLTMTSPAWQPFAALSGVALPVDVSVMVSPPGRAKARKPQPVRFGEDLLFTHRGLSGPASLQISSYWRAGQPLWLNLLPGIERAGEWLVDLKHGRLAASPLSEGKRGDGQPHRQQLGTILSTLLPGRLARAWLAGAATLSGTQWPPQLAAALQGLREDMRLTDLPDARLRELGQALNAWPLVPAGTEGYRKAEVTVGGLATAELDPTTMMARRIPGCYWIGEAVDVTGWLGGYNFQWAWASAWVAARALGNH